MTTSQMYAVEMTTFNYKTQNIETFLQYLRPMQSQNPLINNLINNLEERSFFNKPFDDLISNGLGRELYNSFLTLVAKNNTQQNVQYDQPHTQPYTQQYTQPYTQPHTQQYSHYNPLPLRNEDGYPTQGGPSRNEDGYSTQGGPCYTPNNTSYNQQYSVPYKEFGATGPAPPNTEYITTLSYGSVNQGVLNTGEIQQQIDEIFMMSERFTKSKFHVDKIYDFQYLIQFMTLLDFTITEASWSNLKTFLDNNKEFIKVLTSAYDGMVSEDPFIQHTQCALVDSFTWDLLPVEKDLTLNRKYQRNYN
jgi:hypothetical protein